jgi:uncharacterized damage-inducible protein DinB
MRVADLQRLYDYSSWANAKLLAVVSRLGREQFTQWIAGSYGSIRNTLVHVLSAEWGWLERCGGPRRGERLRSEDYPGVEALFAEWNRVERWMTAFLRELTDEDLTQDVAFALGAGPMKSLPRGEILHHAVIHAVHHRGQVALLLRTLGYEPGNFDFLIYADERSHVAS